MPELLRYTAFTGALLAALAAGGCESPSPADPHDLGFRDGVYAAKAQKSKGLAADLQQTLGGRNDLGRDAGFEPGSPDHDDYRTGFGEGYNQEFGVQ